MAVFGCGPVGIMAQKAAWLKGAKRVIGIDILDYRLAIARKSGHAETLNSAKVNVVEALREMTEGRGPDVCIDAVGMEADRNTLDKLGNIIRAEVGSIKVIETCVSAVRRGGVISVVGVYGVPYRFPFGQIFDKGITIKTGQAPVQAYIVELLQLVRDKKVQLDDIITHTLPLDQAAHAYDIFNKKEDQCLKVILKP